MQERIRKEDNSTLFQIDEKRRKEIRDSVAYTGGDADDEHAAAAILEKAHEEFPEVCSDPDKLQEASEEADKLIRSGEPHNWGTYKEALQTVSERYDESLQNESDEERNSRIVREMENHRDRLRGPHMVDD